jgi:hypothetical protein
MHTHTCIYTCTYSYRYTDIDTHIIQIYIGIRRWITIRIGCRFVGPCVACDTRYVVRCVLRVVTIAQRARTQRRARPQHAARIARLYNGSGHTAASRRQPESGARAAATRRGMHACMYWRTAAGWRRCTAPGPRPSSRRTPRARARRCLLQTSPEADVGRGEPGPGADVGRGEPSPSADVGRCEPSERLHGRNAEYARRHPSTGTPGSASGQPRVGAHVCELVRASVRLRVCV